MGSPQVPPPPYQSLFERVFETALWNSRLIVLLAVIFGVLSSMILFVFGSLEIIETVRSYLVCSIDDSPSKSHDLILIGVIGAIDFYLIAMVLLIFSFGIYELFISKIDIARKHESFHSLLEITSLDDLKNKILKVIIMVLIVTFFQWVLHLGKLYNTIDMALMALSISVICIGIHFLQKLK